MSVVDYIPYFQIASYLAIVVGGSIAIYEFVQSRRRRRGEAILADGPQ